MNTITTPQNETSRRWSRFVMAAGLVATGVLLIGRSPQAATGTLVPALYQTVLDSNGNPIAGAKVCTYLAGTSTPTPTYTDVNLTVPNANPIIADTAGRWMAFLTPGASYKFVLQDATGTGGVCNGAIVRTIDNVAGTPAATIVTTGAWFPSLGGSATYSTQEGTYVRVGALVFARGQIVVTGLGTGSPSAILGLPFPVSGSGPAVVGYFSGLNGTVVWLGGFVQEAGTQVTLVSLPAAGANVVTVAPPVITTGTTLMVSVTYITAAP